MMTSLTPPITQSRGWAGWPRSAPSAAARDPCLVTGPRATLVPRSRCRGVSPAHEHSRAAFLNRVTSPTRPRSRQRAPGRCRAAAGSPGSRGHRPADPRLEDRPGPGSARLATNGRAPRHRPDPWPAWHHDLVRPEHSLRKMLQHAYEILWGGMAAAYRAAAMPSRPFAFRDARRGLATPCRD